MWRSRVRLAAVALLAGVGAAAAPPSLAYSQIGQSPQPPDPASAQGDAAAGSPPPAPLVTPPQPRVEPSAETGSYVLRPGPECADFQAVPGAGWRALIAVRFPGPQGEVRIAAGQTLEPGAYVDGLDLAGILQARCF